MDILIVILPIIFDLLKECKEEGGDPAHVLKDRPALGYWALWTRLRREGYRGKELRRACRAAFEELKQLDDDEINQLIEDA